MADRICKYCGEVFEVIDPRRESGRRYCSPECKERYRKEFLRPQLLEKRRRVSGKYVAKTKSDPDHPSAEEIAKLAFDAKMTYGKYVLKHNL